MQPKRLLMISTDRKIFEEGSDVRGRQVEYAKEWDEVHIVVFSKRNHKSQIPNEITIAPNCWVYSTKSLMKFKYSLDATSLGQFIIERRGITNITCQDPFLTAMAGVSLKKKFVLPLEIQVHTDIGSPNFSYTFSNKIRKTLALSYLPKADTVRVVSNRVKDYLIGSLGINSTKIILKPIIVDVEKIRSLPILVYADLHKKYPQFKKIVLMASRIEKEKNIKLAIKSWKKVVEKVSGAGLIVVGFGRQEVHLKKLVVQLGLNSSIIFDGWAEHNALISYYKSADLLLVTSLFEGYGMTLVEAKAAGCKIVSTDVGVAREVGAEIVGWSEKEVVDAVIESLG